MILFYISGGFDPLNRHHVVHMRQNEAYPSRGEGVALVHRLFRHHLRHRFGPHPLHSSNHDDDCPGDEIEQEHS